MGEWEITTRRKAALSQIYATMHPHTVRGGAYQLWRPHKLIDSMEKTNTNIVSALLTAMREDGTLPWEWIVDESRVFESTAVDADPEAFLDRLETAYRADWWKDQARLVVVVAEKATVGGVIRPALEPYRVPFLIVHGNSSATALHNLADLNARDGRPMSVLYCGDWDCAGVFMSDEDIPNRLKEYGAPDCEVVRVGVFPWQITEPDAFFSAADQLAVRREAEKKKGKKDPFATRLEKHIARHGPMCAELDALDPRILRSRLEQLIEQHVEPKAWEAAQVREQEEQAMLGDFFATWRDFVDEQQAADAEDEDTEA